MDVLSDQEKKILAPFVTNTDRDVFVLRHLPEVIKGALFSRYSRSEKGVRRLLLDEFITNKDINFDEVIRVQHKETNDETLAIQKAQKFYDRILDGYGDDSIGELGGAHIALENVSIMATKILEDARIGGSPLEKSTRYVWFNKKVNNEYQFYKDPKIMQSPLGNDFVEVMNRLFDTYNELIEPMKEFFTQRIPQEPGTPLQAYNWSIRAKACDILRPLLPCCTKTNMGFFGNGRFFEYLITKLRCHPLTEMHGLAEDMQAELNKVIPSFVRRCTPDNKHFNPTHEFVSHVDQVASRFASRYAGSKIEPTEDEVTLIDHSSLAEEKMFATLLYQHSKQPLTYLRRCVREMTFEQRKQLLESLFAKRSNRRHKPPRAFENIVYTFDLLGDFGCYRDLHRHRILTQERQDLSTAHGYITPQEIIDAGFQDKWDLCMKRADELYRKLVVILPKEAQYVVPLAYKVRWYVTINARSLFWLVELRTGAGGHANYRRMSQKMYEAAKEVHPLIFEYCKYVDMNDYSLGRLQSEVRIAKKGIVKEE